MNNSGYSLRRTSRQNFVSSKKVNPLATEEEQKDESSQQKLVDKTKSQYQKLYRIIQIREDDSFLIIIGKLLLTIVGIGLMILFSPIILLVLIIAFFAAF